MRGGMTMVGDHCFRQRAQGARRCAVQRVVQLLATHLGVFPPRRRTPGWSSARWTSARTTGGRPNLASRARPAGRTMCATHSSRALGGWRSRSTVSQGFFDTGDHHIGGVQQQQGGGYGSVIFTSRSAPSEYRRCAIWVRSRSPRTRTNGTRPAAQSQYQSGPAPQPSPETPTAKHAFDASGDHGDSGAIFAAIESLAGLHQRWLSSPTRSSPRRKAELLSRL